MKSYKWLILLIAISLSYLNAEQKESPIEVKVTVEPRVSNGEPVRIIFFAESSSQIKEKFYPLSVETKKNNWRISGPISKLSVLFF